MPKEKTPPSLAVRWYPLPDRVGRTGARTAAEASTIPKPKPWAESKTPRCPLPGWRAVVSRDRTTSARRRPWPNSMAAMPETKGTAWEVPASSS